MSLLWSKAHFTSIKIVALNCMAVIGWCHYQYLYLWDGHWVLGEVMGTLFPKAACTMYEFNSSISLIWKTFLSLIKIFLAMFAGNFATTSTNNLCPPSIFPKCLKNVQSQTDLAWIQEGLYKFYSCWGWNTPLQKHPNSLCLVHFWAYCYRFPSCLAGQHE